MAIDARNVSRLNMPQWRGGDRPNYRIGGAERAAGSGPPRPGKAVQGWPSAQRRKRRSCTELRAARTDLLPTERERGRQSFQRPPVTLMVSPVI
jgi:hypothetical protein